MSTVLVKDGVTTDSAATQVLIEEARHRQRRRWLWRAVTAAGVALAIGVALAFAVGGAGSSSERQLGSKSAGSLGLSGRRATVEGSFLGIGGPAGAGPMKLSGTIRFVTDNGRRTYTTTATDGHWKTKLPAGTYTVQGLSKQVNGGRSWGTLKHLVVPAGQTQDNVRVVYGTIR